MAKLLTFSDTDEDLTKINDSQFLLARMRCFAEGQTSHGWKFDLDTIKQASFSLLGKPVLWAYDIWHDDAAGHEESEIACGFIPESAKTADIQYVYDKEHDKTFVEVNCYIWKKYAAKMVEILKKTDGVKDVSSEIWLIEQDDDDEWKVLQYVYTGVTILGEHINPAVKGADIKVVKFSDDFENAKAEFIKELRNSNEEGDKMGDEIKNSEVQELDNSVEHKTVSVSVTSYTDKYDDNGNYIGSEDESHRKSVSTVTKVDDEKMVDNADCDDEIVKETNAEVNNSDANNEVVVEENNSDNSATDDTCDYQAMYNSAQETIANLTAELNTLKNSYSEMEVKCSVLEEYKANKETEEMTKAVNCAIAEVADCFSASEIEEWKAKAVNCSNIDAFKNEIKASAFDKQKKSATSIRNPIPMDFAENKTKTNEALWDRVANEVNK